MFQLFRSRAASPPPVIAGEPFPYPIPGGPRLALFASRFRETDLVVIAANVPELARLNVKTVAAPMSVIRGIDPACWMPEYPMIVLSNEETGFMQYEDRNYIWETFGMPVFEYLLDASGRIVARECEAHEGLHIERELGFEEVESTDEPCACGRAGSRILRPSANSAVDAII
jgi:hypothetical protein